MSLQTQIDAAAYGSVVTVAAGTYTEAVTITKPLTLRADGRVEIRGPAGHAGIRIAANHVTIEGRSTSSRRRDDGIEANGFHHLVVRGVTAHDCGESGIQFNWCEFVTVEECTCHGNARLGWFSGISVYQCREIAGDAATSGFRTIVRNNVCRDNWTHEGTASDGNGIIIDDMNSTQDTSFPPYPHPTLVENNLCTGNGGKGIAIHWSDHATVRNNTVAGNNGDPRNDATWRGDLSNQSASHNSYVGNVCVCDPATNPHSTAIGNYGPENTGNEWTMNLAWPPERALNTDGANNRIAGTLVADPELVDFAPTNPAAAAIGWRPGVRALPQAAPPPLHTSIFAGHAPSGILTDPQAYELGTIVELPVAGTITALRLYRTNATPQTLSLWKDGKVLLTAAIPGGGEGWAQSDPIEVPVAAGERVIVSVGKAADQRYAADNDALPAPVEGAVTIPAGGGVFAAQPGELPAQTFRNSYYWTDLVFLPK